ncbi:hypothetical protein QMK33_18955 [Hymenobacter sp. H14-R3]|uniref:hypothetical protein n=1 Tax=Hymenobacter sp. H14-R3 TaxID=3046308 RepID=UPI0024BADD24|nr:hypothetical protein [Hymenobacter sp. H14-R3]MDJ0367233.1 hypothetical protein [Hymenobacter sp. H14-R3]
MQTVLCIPGPWASRTEFMQALIKARDGEYLFIGGLLAKPAADVHFFLELYEADPELEAAFGRAGRFSAMSETAVAAIGAHQMVAYLLTPPDMEPSHASARAVAQAAAALLDAGGLAVKVETAGKAFEAAQWQALAAADAAGALWELFVAAAIGTPEGAFFTCGMHNLGLKDALVRHLPAADATHLLREFTCFGVAEQPVLAPGHTFSMAADAPVYRLTEAKQQPYAGYPDFENPYGMWELVAK